MERKTTTRQKRMIRERMDNYVMIPTNTMAWYTFFIGLAAGMAGFGITVWVNPEMNIMQWFSALVVWAALPIAAFGLGGRVKLNKRLDEYFYDILDQFGEEKEEHIKDDPQPPQNNMRDIPVNGRGGQLSVVTIDGGSIDAKYITAFAVAAIARNSGVSRNAIVSQCESAHWYYAKISQPMYKKIIDYLIDNKWAKQGRNGAELTPDGIRYLMTKLPPTEQPHVLFSTR